MGDLGGGVVVLGLGAIGGDRAQASTVDHDRAGAVDAADQRGRRAVGDDVDEVHAAARGVDVQRTGVIGAAGGAPSGKAQGWGGTGNGEGDVGGDRVVVARGGTGTGDDALAIADVHDGEGAASDEAVALVDAVGDVARAAPGRAELDLGGAGWGIGDGVVGSVGKDGEVRGLVSAGDVDRNRCGGAVVVVVVGLGRGDDTGGAAAHRISDG